VSSALVLPRTEWFASKCASKIWFAAHALFWPGRYLVAAAKIAAPVGALARAGPAGAKCDWPNSDKLSFGRSGGH
jgi:hypothetical protein